MKTARLRGVVYLAIPILAGGIFAAGLFTPLGIVNWVWYFIPLLLSVFVGGRVLPFVLAALLSVLMMAGHFLSPMGPDSRWAFESHLMSVGVLWVAAFLISQHKRTVQEMRTLSRTAEQSPVSIVITDKAGNIEYVNRKFTEITGYSSREVTGKNPRILKSGEMPPGNYKRLWETINGGGEWRGEFHNRKKNGELYWESASLSPVLDPAGNIVHFVAVKEDITERKRVEQQLAETLDLNQKIILGAPVGVVVYKKTSGQCVLANEAAARTLNATVSQLLRQNFRQLESWRVSGMLKTAEAVLATGSPQQCESHFVSTFDKEVWLVCHFSPFVLGNEPHLLLLFSDETERKRAEAEIAHLASFPKLDPTPTIEVDKTGQITFLNQAAMKKFPDLKKLGSQHPFLADLAAAYAAIQASPTDSLIREVTIGNLCYQQVMYYVTNTQCLRVYGFDVTERKRAEEQAHEEALLLDLAQDAIVARDLEDRILYWNKGAEQLFGWTRPEALGQPAWKLLHEETLKHQNAMKLVLEKSWWNGELTCQDKKGHKLIVETRLTLVRDQQGKPKSILGISTNITEKKKIEAQFLRSQRMESLGTLAGGIAHDLNNVLTPLLVAVQVLREKVTDADGQQLLESLETNVRRGSSLVKQVLAFGRGMEGERAVVQPKHIAREIKQIVQETFPKSVEFEFHAASDLWNIIGDPTQLHQVLLNLCVNARDAMPNGGKLSIHMENVMLDETFVALNLEAKTGPYVCIKVTDTGTGIPKAIQERIFDPFFTTKEPGKGTGLGLSTTLAIVKSHGGFINCYSEPDKGSVFKAYFPAGITPVAEEKMAAEPSKLPPGHNELILVVDDEEPILNIARKTLERFGYRVLLAGDGAKAVSLYTSRQQEIATVIMDMVMPVMDGPATISALKAINPDVKIISSSGLGSDDGLAKAKNTGIRHFIPKPYTAETMLVTLNAVLLEKPAKPPGQNNSAPG